MGDFMPYIWIVIAICAAVVEASTVSLVSMWFIPSAIIASVLALCRVPVLWQIVVFLVLSIVCIVLQKTLFKRFFSGGDTRTNLDMIVGEKGIVTERIDNIIGIGQLKIKGSYWSARSVSGEQFEVGDVLTVVAIEGVKLICKK